MIELTKDKQYSHKDPRFKYSKNNILFDLSKAAKFTSAVISNYTNYAKTGLEKQDSGSTKHQSYKSTTLPKINNEKVKYNSESKNEITLYLGNSVGNIFALNLKYTKHLIHSQNDEISQLKVKDHFKHKGGVSVLLWELIEGNAILFSAGVDSSIKLWNLEADIKYSDHYIKTLLGHSGSIISLAYCKSRQILVSSSVDSTLRVWKLDDNFDKILNPLFHCINVFKKFNSVVTNPPFWISNLCIKDTDTIELFASDTEGAVHVYEYFDEIDEYSYELGKKVQNFNYIKTVKNHNMNCLKVVSSNFDSTIYTIGFDNKLIAYNFKEKKKSLNIFNNKSFFTCFIINSSKQEVILADDKGFVTFVKIFNHSESKIKYSNSRISFIFKVNIKANAEHLILVSEDSIDIVRIKREVKTVNVQLHEAEIIKLFVMNPIKNTKGEIVEDTKIISAGRDNKIKFWDFLTMEHISTINCPEIKERNMCLSSICYLSKANLIVLGTDLGKIYFYDLIKSTYLKFEGNINHKLEISSIVNFEIAKNAEYVFITSLEGLISIWELDRQELKLKLDRIESDNDNLNKLMNFNILSRKELEKLNAKEVSKLREFYSLHAKEKLSEKYNKERNLKNEEDDNVIKNTLFKYSPNLRHIINTQFMLKEVGIISNYLEIYCCQFSKWSSLLYTGGEKGQLYAWNYSNGNHKYSLKGHNSDISSMTMDRHLLISGDKEGKICIWSTDLNTILYSLLNKENLNARIIDLQMIPQFGILISLNSVNQLEFWKYENRALVKALVVNNKELTCVTFVDYYGKILCGTMDNVVIERDLGEILSNLQIKHSFSKFPFLNQVASNNNFDEKDNIDNYKIMKSITKDVYNV